MYDAGENKSHPGLKSQTPGSQWSYLREPATEPLLSNKNNPERY